MKRVVSSMIFLLAGFVPAVAQVPSYPPGTVISYELLDGSYFVDECLICDRVTVLQPMRGTFDLVVEQDTAPYARYAVGNIHFTASPAWAGEVQLTGNGTYVRFEEVAVLRDMELALQVKDVLTNQPAWFTNDSRLATVPFPLIDVRLTQTNGSIAQTFSLQIIAAPMREIWFSTTKDFVSTNRSSPTNRITAGDLISNRGRVVKRNLELVGRLGVMPVVPDLGLDAVHVGRGGEVLYSIPGNVFSESQGLIQHGDLLSDRGPVMKRNQALLAAFKMPSNDDAGLNAVQVMPGGEIWFSIRSNVTVNATLTLGRGDILSDLGRVVFTHEELMANFQPTTTNRDFGLDAFFVLPGGEIWFSVEEGFVDNRLGPVLAGDLLSNRGSRVFRNSDLLRGFAPADSTADYGLDAVFVVTDTCSPKPPPRIARWSRVSDSLRFEWEGEGAVFQLESAHGVEGPWSPCGEIVPALTGNGPCDTGEAGLRVYRVRQW